MSFNENYDKVFLTAGGILGLIGIGVGVWFYTGLDEKYTIDSSIRSKKVEVPGIAEAQKLEKMAAADHNIQRPKIGAHFFDVFVGPTLFLPKDTTEPVDIHDGKPIHPPIPNSWFIENGLVGELSYSDALYRDTDGDGFTIMEEFEAGTNPRDAASHPLLIKKLALTNIKNRAYEIIFNSDDNGEFGFRGTTIQGNILWRQTVAKGQKFGQASTDLDRFLLKDVVQKEFQNQAIGMVEKDSVAIVEDLNPAKAGKTYELRKGSRYPQRILDSTAFFTIVAGNKAGTEFQVEEGLTFKIPGDDKTEYTLKTINTQTGTVTVTATANGKETTWNIKKTAQ